MLQLNEVEKEYQTLIKVDAIKEDSNVISHLKWQKATHDLSLAEGLLKISTNNKIKESLGYTDDTTFFDWVIISSYYSIFHATQALLGMKRIKIEQRLHYATLVSFAKHFIINNQLAEDLFFIYEDAESKANELLEILEEEKAKRGHTQYQRLSKENLGPAEKSINNAKIYLKSIQEILKNKRIL